MTTPTTTGSRTRLTVALSTPISRKVLARLRYFILLYLMATFAVETAQAEQEAESLPAVTVYAEAFDSDQNPSSFTGEDIGRIPATNGNLAGAIRLLPDIQLGTSRQGADEIGEILPPEISIAGGNGYQNNFLVDGATGINLIEPNYSSTPNNINSLPGLRETLILDGFMVETISIHKSAIPALYGWFSGGVVEVESKRPTFTLGGELFYRHTSDRLTAFTPPEGSNESEPVFRKDHFGASIDTPLSDSVAIRSSFSRLESIIPVDHLGESVNTHRIRSNFAARLDFIPTASNEHSLSLLTSTYTGEHLLRNVKGSAYSLTIDTISTSYSFNKTGGRYDQEYRLSASRYSSKRQAPGDLRGWKITAATDRDWGATVGSSTSTEGGLGNLANLQHSVGTGATFTRVSGRNTRTFTTDLTYYDGTIDRDSPATIYLQPNYRDAALTVICDDDILSCESGVQYFARRNRYPEDSADASMLTLALSGENLYQRSTFTFVSGVRLDANDFTSNTDIAPRLKLDLTPHAADITYRFGLNRYYDAPLFAAKLREAQHPHLAEFRTMDGSGHLSEWLPSSGSGTIANRFSSLKTPYTDEVMTAIEWKTSRSVTTLEYLHRWGNDLYSRRIGEFEADGFRYAEFRNDGTSELESVSLAHRWSNGTTTLHISVTHQEKSTNTDRFDDLISEDDLDDEVYLDGKIVGRDQLPSYKFTEPVSGKILLQHFIGSHLSLTTIGTYSDGYRSPVYTGTTIEDPLGREEYDGETGVTSVRELKVYTTEEGSPSLVWDLKTEWNPAGKKEGIVFELEVLNLFNHQTQKSPTVYAPGRQVWLGARYRF